jgi:LacI family transcriptional regulator
MKPKKVTIHDIARKLNLTASTVSRALNDHPKISDATKQLVLQTSRELNYRPNTLAASLRKGKAKTIGLVVPRINRNFISNAIFGIEKVTNEFGYNLIICQSEESLEKEILNLKTLVNSRVDGILISISLQTNTSRHIKAIINDGIPLIQFDRYLPDIETGKVLNDNFQAAYDAVKHLINKGCKKIIHFGGPENISIYSERRNGYKQAMADSGIGIDDDLIYHKILLKEEGYCKAYEIFKSGNIPDAIFSASDYSALGALLAAKEIGIDIPGKLSIIGFANEPFTEFVTPSLTSLEQYGAEMGSTAARMLLNKIGENEKEFYPDTIIIKPKLILRDSC